MLTYLFLVGGLEHLFFPILEIIVPIDSYFPDGFKPPTSVCYFDGSVGKLICSSQVGTMGHPFNLWIVLVSLSVLEKRGTKFKRITVK